MKKSLPLPGATETRWLMILPVAALAMGCESKGAETSQEPVIPAAASEEAAAVEDLNSKAAESEPVPPTADQGATVSGQNAVSGQGASGQSAAEASGEAVAAAPSTAPELKPATDKKVDAPAEASPVRRGAAAKGEGFTVWMEGKSTHGVNEPSSVSVVLLPEAPFKCNEEYPYRFTAAASPGIQYKDSVIRSMNVSKERSTMTIPFTPSAKGPQTISGELSFSVCTDDKCLIEKQNVSLAVDVGGS